MANEAAMRQRIGEPVDFTVADGTGIEKGALLKMTDNRTAIGSTAKGDAIAGIAAREKIADDGRTQLAVWRTGIFDMTASGAITVGWPVASYSTTGFLNTVGDALGLKYSGAQIIGHAMETASDAEVVQIYVNIGAGSS